MIIVFRPHDFIPIIGEWCRNCRKYTDHANGFTPKCHPMIQCHNCGHATVIP